VVQACSAHVCHDWRSLVLAFPSQLQLRLYFADKTPTKAAVLDRLSHLPIIVDYCKVTWNARTQKRLISALRYPDRVRRISIRGSVAYDDDESDRIFKVLDVSFPALERLELDNILNVERVLQSQSFMNSIRSLRHLQLDNVCFIPLSSILSVTTSLVDLTLDIETLFLSTEGATFLTHLQRMPHLRNLQVCTGRCSIVPLPSTTSVLLPALTSFRVFGGCPDIEWFASGSKTPSLRELHIRVAGIGNDTLRIPYLSNFIRVTGIAFFAARLSISGPGLTTCLYAHPHSIHGSPFKTIWMSTSLQSDPGSALSAMLATLEDVFLFYKPSPLGLVPWREFFKEFRNVKVLRLHHGPETQVAEMLRQAPVIPPSSGEEVNPDATTSSGTPINSDRNQLTLDISPSLEEIVVYEKTSDMSIDEKGRASVIESFGPFATARREVGRPVKVFWSTDRKVPRYADKDQCPGDLMKWPNFLANFAAAFPGLASMGFFNPT
jgi:hypothetical protein